MSHDLKYNKEFNHYMIRDDDPRDTFGFHFSKTMKDSLEIARADLNAARILFENDLFPASVFHLQQAVEKGYKSYNFFIGSIDENKAKRKISHRTSDLRQLIDLNRQERFETLIKKARINPEDKKLVDQVFQIDSSKEVPSSMKPPYPFLIELREVKDIRCISENKIKSALSEINKCHIRMNDARTQTYSKKYHDIVQKEITNNSSHPFATFCTREEAILLAEGRNTNPELDIFDIYQNVFRNNLEISFEILSLILDPHAIDSRYQKENFCPLSFYTQKLPLIRKFEKLCNLTEISLEFFKTFVTDCDDFQKNGKLIKNYNFDIPV